MTDVSYKILMSLKEREIEKHIAENKIGKFEQAGFKGENILDNLFILRECVEETTGKRTNGGNSDRLKKSIWFNKKRNNGTDTKRIKDRQ